MKTLRIFLFIIVSLTFFTCQSYAKEVYQIRINAAITPPVSSYILDSLKKAQEARAEARLIQLDTPGGLDTSMREIIKAIMDSAVPVVVYVSPSGARAASAGAIIMIAAHVAAMAPGTNIGAAHPVNIGGDKADKEMMAKVVQDAEAYARSLAAKRGRNVEWVAKAVTKSVSITADEAATLHVIDVVAATTDELLAKIDGMRVDAGNKSVKLVTKSAKVVSLEMPFKYKFLSLISDPNVAYFLMMIGFLGILFEIYSPGAIFPGVVGGMALVLAFYSFQSIPISYAGLALIILGIIFFVLELKVTSYGMLAVAGIASVVLGSIMLIDLPATWLSLSWKSIATVGVITTLFFLGVLSYAVKAQLPRPKTGREGLVGERGTARTDLSPSMKGKVFVHGELWEARSDDVIAAGGEVIITAVNGMTLNVKQGGE